MPSTSYLITVLAMVFAITLALRAVPFVLLRTLREAPIVQVLANWMPVGILAILAITALHGTVRSAPATAGFAVLAVAVTVIVHLTLGRRTILSVCAGTATYVLMVNLL